MKRELIIDNGDAKLDEQDIKDMKRIYEDIDTLVAGEKTHCVMNVLLNLPLTYMLRNGKSDSYIISSVKTILKKTRKHMEKDE